MISTFRSQPRSWRFPAFVFALMTVALYFPVLRGKTPFPLDTVVQFPAWWSSGSPHGTMRAPVADIGDLVTAFYPFRAFAAAAVRSGRIPLWNPYILAGAPFLANAQSALFYPFTTLYYVMGLPAGWTAAIVLRTFLAAVFMWLFVRSLGATQPGAILSGIVYATCGFMTAWQGQPMGDAAMWLPFILYAVRRLSCDLSMRSTALAAFGFAMPVLAGHPETAAHVTLAGIAWAGATGGLRPRFWLRFALAGVLAAGLASVQMIATLEWLHHVGTTWDSGWPALPLREAFGFVSRDNLRSPNSAGVEIPEAAAYAGMITLLLSPLAIFHERRRHAIFLAFMIVFAFGVAYGLEPMHWLAQHAPVVKAVKNWRAILLADFGIAAMAGLGLSAIQQKPEILRGRKRMLALGLTIAVFALAFVSVYELQRATSFRVEFLRRPSFSRFLLVAGALPIFLWLCGRVRGRSCCVAICGLAAFDMITFGYGYTSFADRSDIFPSTAVFRFLEEHADPFAVRIAAIPDPYPVNSPMMYGLAAADGYDVRLLRIREFTSGYSEGSPDSVAFASERFFEQNDRRLDLLNIRYFVVYAQRDQFQEFSRRGDRYAPVFHDGNVAVFENKRVLPRAFAVPASGVVLSAAASAVERLKDPSFDPERMVVLTHPLPVATPTNKDFQSGVDILSADINSYTLRSRASGPAVLVISQTYYPGWKAFVDGRETPVFDADYALTGVLLAEGMHEVRLIFGPRSFKLGLSLTLTSAAVLVGMAFRRPDTSSR